ncbi:N-acetylmuramoyl-L-alanine amidase [Nitrosomonas sp. PY1]|uniref:N-acetylmuramoyl-L-alanine amidase n=1 Tax=Nitrosomonas sp. PY1 TaxID=1803906 RepID=UPI001FC7FCBA|nr:N-acetylmuramoyl-L-alanine amidase [Nitrosomonas sp. PY1]
MAKSEKNLNYFLHASCFVFAKKILASAFLLILLFSLIDIHQTVLAADENLQSVNVGLTPNYTRITLESKQQIQYELSTLENPHRVILDLSNIKLSNTLGALTQKVNAIDPLVQKIRIGQFKPAIVRLVFDLKANVIPHAFVLKPQDGFSHRLVLDIYHPDKASKLNTPYKKFSNRKTDYEPDGLDELVNVLLLNEPSKKLAQTQAQRPHPKPEKNDSHANRVGNNSTTKNQNRKAVMVPKIIVVAIDAGHGGKDPGAIGYQGTQEKDITLAIARKLKERIDKEPNMRAVLTRNGDYYISLPQRRINARRANADLFVSIHADANPKSHAHGSSVFTLSEHGASSTTASWLANKENSVDNDLMGGIDITSKSRDIKELLLDLSLNAAINDSSKLADEVLQQLGKINHLHKRNVEQAGFAVLKSPDIPSILVETAFLSNPKEEEKLRSQDYQNKMANAVFLGIKGYFASNPAMTRAEISR